MFAAWRVSSDIHGENPTILHPDAGSDFFASRTIVKAEMAEYYYRSLAYSKMTEEWQTTKTYGKGVMQATAKMFQERMNE